MRSYAREVAFCKIYTYLITNQCEEGFDQFDMDKLTEEDLDFAKKLVSSYGISSDKIIGAVANTSIYSFNAFLTSDKY